MCLMLNASLQMRHTISYSGMLYRDNKPVFLLEVINSTTIASGMQVGTRVFDSYFEPPYVRVKPWVTPAVALFAKSFP